MSLPTPEELALALIFSQALAEEQPEEIIEVEEPEEENVLLSLNLDEVDNLKIVIKISVSE